MTQSDAPFALPPVLQHAVDTAKVTRQSADQAEDNLRKMLAEVEESAFYGLPADEFLLLVLSEIYEEQGRNELAIGLPKSKVYHLQGEGSGLPTYCGRHDSKLVVVSKTGRKLCGACMRTLSTTSW